MMSQIVMHKIFELIWYSRIEGVTFSPSLTNFAGAWMLGNEEFRRLMMPSAVKIIERYGLEQYVK